MSLPIVPKFVPLIVTVVPMGPFNGEKFEIVGATAQTDPAAKIMVRQRRTRRIEADMRRLLTRAFRRVFKGIPLLCARILVVCSWHGRDFHHHALSVIADGQDSKVTGMRRSPVNSDSSV